MSFRPRLLELEIRDVPATFNVSTTADGGADSLRAAIILANSTAGHDIVSFADLGTGTFSIDLLSALPALTDPSGVTLDGYTALDATPNTQATGTNANLAITINGSALSGANAVDVQSSNNVIRGLVIQNFADGVAVLIAGPVTGNVVAGNFIGTDRTGSIDAANQDGVVIADRASGNRIGGADPADRNLISGNSGYGVNITGFDSTTPVQGNLVQGNIIGLNAAGDAALGNLIGVLVDSGAVNNLVGGPTTTAGTEAGNVISGNVDAGIDITGLGTSGNTIQGNLIGTDSTGMLAVGNGGSGIDIENGATGNRIGGPTATTGTGVGNVISGNAIAGVEICMVDSDSGTPTGNNFVQGNLIGLAADGETSLGNFLIGVFINSGAANNTIGGANPNTRNVISGNNGGGILLDLAGIGNVVRSNYIGTDRTGLDYASNGDAGVIISSTSSTQILNNVISGNFGPGVGFDGSAGPTSGNVVAGNLIGVGADGLTPLGNFDFGVGLGIDVTNNIIGGTALGSGNVIANNFGGVVIGVDPSDVGTVGNSVLGNSIGSNTCGCLPGDDFGIDLGFDGVTPNGANPQSFPNNGQNYPVLTTAGTDGMTLTVLGTLTSRPNATFRVELFASPPGGALSDFRYGVTYLGFVTVTTDAVGNGSFRFSSTVPGGQPVGQFITATATFVGTGDTSEFSAAVASIGVPVVQPTALPTGVTGTGYQQTLTATGGAGGPYAFAVTAGSLPPGATLAADGTLSGTPTQTGTFSFTVTATDSAGLTGSRAYVIGIDPLSPSRIGLFAVGAGGGGGQVNVYNADGSLRFALIPYAGFLGGVTVATGDVNNDGTADVITGTTIGSSHVKVFDGVTGGELLSFLAFDGFQGGITVSAGDVNGDGFADIIVGTVRAASHVKVFEGQSGGVIQSFLAFPDSFGVTVGSGDVNRDGFDDIVVGAAGGSSVVKVFDGQSTIPLLQFDAFAGYTGGVNVAGGDLDGDGFSEVLVGANANGHVKAFGADGDERLSFLAYPGFSGAVRIGGADTNGDGKIEILTGTGPSTSPHVKRFDGQTLSLLSSFFAFDPSFTGGIFVG